MKKTKLLTLAALISLFTASCGCSHSNTSLSREEESEDVSSEVSSTSTDESVSGSVTSTSEEKEPLVSDLTEENYKSFITYYRAKFNKFNSFKAKTEGVTKSSTFGIEVDQSILVDTIKASDYTYMKNESHSSLVNTVHLAYYHDDKALYKDNDETNYHLKTLKDYLDKYGTYPLDKGIEGYKINDETILSISLAKDGDNYTFNLGLDPEKATTNVRIQMKQFGGLSDYPIFSEMNLKVTVKNDYTPIKIEVDSKYQASMSIFTSDCHQTYTNTFSNINEELVIEDLNNVKDLFNGEVEAE